MKMQLRWLVYGMVAACAGTTAPTAERAATQERGAPAAVVAPAADAVTASQPPPMPQVIAEAPPCAARLVKEDPSIFHLTAERNYTWEPGTTLNVYFMDGQLANMKTVAENAVEWSKYANINFRFYATDETPPPGPSIRVSFQGGGYWSLVGSQAAYRSADQPTLNLNHRLFTQSRGEIHRVVLHEFGHALGLHHEHQNPNFRVTWNREAIYKWYAEYHGWDKDTVDSNILDPMDPDDVTASEFDVHSIMAYSFPRNFTEEGIYIPYNTELSELDKATIAKLYPGRDVATDGNDPDGADPDETDPDETDPGIDEEVDEEALARTLTLDYGVAAVANSNTKNYGVALVGNDAILDRIEYVLYQRQHVTFPEFAAGTYYRSDDRGNGFVFGWQGWGWAPVAARIVFKSGTVASLRRDQAPRPIADNSAEFAAAKRNLTFEFLRGPIEDGVAFYRIAIADATLAKYVHFVEYQRQHASFREYNEGTWLREDAQSDGFAMLWQAYGWTPIEIRVHFKDGSTVAYSVDEAPTPVE